MSEKASKKGKKKGGSKAAKSPAPVNSCVWRLTALAQKIAEQALSKSHPREFDLEIFLLVYTRAPSLMATMTLWGRMPKKLL